jgi:hypothetical protein
MPGVALIAAATAASAGGAQPEFSAERMKAHVSFLADDLLEGREAGTSGHELAARYVASQLSSSPDCHGPRSASGTSTPSCPASRRAR